MNNLHNAYLHIVILLTLKPVLQIAMLLQIINAQVEINAFLHIVSSVLIQILLDHVNHHAIPMGWVSLLMAVTVILTLIVHLIVVKILQLTRLNVYRAV